MLSAYPDAMSYVDRSRAIHEELGDRVGVASCLITAGSVAYNTTDFGKALATFRAALEILEEGDWLQIAMAHNNIGVIHDTMGNYAGALEAYLVSVRIYEEKGEELRLAMTMGNVGNVYYYLHDHDRAYDFQTRALDVFRRLGLEHNVAMALGNLSSVYKERNDYGAALDVLTQALEIFQKIGDRRFDAATRVKLGTLHDMRGDTVTALEQMLAAAAIAREIGHDQTFSDAMHRIGELHLRRGDHRRAVDALNEGLAAAERAGMIKPQADLHQVLAEAYRAGGATPSALDHLSQCLALREELYGEERQRAVAEMQARFDVERAEREREIFRLKSEHLEQINEQRARELTALAMHLVQKNTFLQKLRKDALALSKAHPEARGPFEEMLRALATNLRDDDDWQRFEQEFRHVHHGFVQMLSERYPKLTPTELKVCALLKINLSNKEIGKLLSVSLRNVESHRYSIRKKLELPSDVNLSTYLAAL
jgi:tetratricopeptide (TPR) repeat protein